MNKTAKTYQTQGQDRKSSVSTKPKETYNATKEIYVPEEEVIKEEPAKEEVKIPEPEPEPEPEKWEIVRHYFKVSDRKKDEIKKKFDVDFLMTFKDVIFI